MQLVKQVFKMSLAASMVFSACAVAGQVEKFEIPQLDQEVQHETASKRIAAWFSRSLYKKIRLDDELSNKIFDRFIDNLDYNKSIFLQKDIDAFSKYKNKFDDGIQLGKLEFAFDIYQESLNRRIKRYEHAIALLDKEMDFTKDDAFYYDREDIEWAKTEAELDEFWRQKTKFDALNLKLAGKEPEKIKETLTKRYTNAMRRLSQSQNEDAFQLVMNSFARSIEAHTSYLSPRRAERFTMEMNL